MYLFNTKTTSKSKLTTIDRNTKLHILN